MVVALCTRKLDKTLHLVTGVEVGIRVHVPRTDNHRNVGRGCTEAYTLPAIRLREDLVAHFDSFFASCSAGHLLVLAVAPEEAVARIELIKRVVQNGIPELHLCTGLQVALGHALLHHEVPVNRVGEAPGPLVGLSRRFDHLMPQTKLLLHNLLCRRSLTCTVPAVDLVATQPRILRAEDLTERCRWRLMDQRDGHGPGKEQGLPPQHAPSCSSHDHGCKSYVE
mmetsp:Transcript_93823/g.223072  ORF Transcript_93823/g.223072 Transcript_93823/m.223072 type:complete len:224 (-) Transcript_93823:34-705(-)